MTPEAEAEAGRGAGSARPDPPELASPEVLKPHLRGWLHAGAAPLVLGAGIVLTCLASSSTARLACAVYASSGLALFGTSALYHRLTWSASRAQLLRRLDHSNIYLMIAGSYTPIATLGLHGTAQTALLWFVWVGAALGILFRVFWVGAPRALYTGLYMALGWSIFLLVGELFSRNGPAVGVLVVSGGVAYTLGAVVYAIRRPDPSPRWFGFHEVFHAFTVIAWACQYVAIALLVHRS